MNAPYKHPLRNGVSASCVVTPDGHWPTLLDFLSERFPSVTRERWQQRMQTGEVQDHLGQPLLPGQIFSGGTRIYYYRAVDAEIPIPHEAETISVDANLLVVDKPHFLPVIPSGKYLQETLLVRLRRQFGNEAISPIHRIDRDTAGLVLFAMTHASRNAYQELFRKRQVKKVYEAIAPWKPSLEWPQSRSTHICTGRHFMQQCESEGPVNAITTITPIEVRDTIARYRLEPVTGQRHQLRVHMAALGIPILNDGIYPTLTPESHDYLKRPLQLLAKELEFIDPWSGALRKFHSRRSLNFS